MSEVAVAFPNDETTAEVIASRLRADGIAARVDLGLHGATRLVPARGEVTVFVDARDAAKAHKVLGTKPRAARAPGSFERGAVVLLVVALAVAIVAFAAALVTR
jgi:hypothetical protein